MPPRSALSLYLDTSALIKLLVDEAGWEEARSPYSEADGVRTTAIAHVEATAALARMRRGNRLTPHSSIGRSMISRTSGAGPFSHAVDDALLAKAVESAVLIRCAPMTPSI